MKNILIFIAGSITGSVITWKIIEKKYKDLADEEIESVKEHLKKNKKNTTEVINIESGENQASKIIIDEGYATEDPVEISYLDIISPEHYGELDDYETKSLTYYIDDVLTDEIDQPISKDIIGEENLNHFGEYEDDSVYIRDNKNKIDYEILKSEKEYSKIQTGDTY